MANEAILEAHEANFSSILKSRKSVVVDFWAEWCGPCHTLAPILDELADAYAGKVRVAKVNIDHNPGLASRYGVRSIPTLLVFRGGEVVETRVGAGSKREMSSLFEQALKKH